MPPAAGVLLTSEIPGATPALTGVEAGAGVELGFVGVSLQAQNSAVAARVADSASLGI
jgi:hypothetical protein